MIEQQLDRFLLTDRLGSGSLGDVYMAELFDPLPGDEARVRQKAIKVIDPQLADRPGFRQALRRLAAFSANVERNENVLACTLREGDGRLYLEMDFLPDRSLQTYLHRPGRKELPVETAVALVLHIASIVYTALHEAGFAPGEEPLLAHGALHPRNVLLQRVAEESEPDLVRLFVADFGQADLRRRLQTDVPYRGLAPYTPPALLPDDASSGQEVPPADERADLYALGQLLYLLLHGKHFDPQAISGETIFAGSWAQLPPEVSDLRREAEKMALAAMHVYAVRPDPAPEPADEEEENTPENAIDNYFKEWTARLQTLLEMAAGEMPPLLLSGLSPPAPSPVPATAAPPPTTAAIIQIDRAGNGDRPLPGVLPRFYQLRPRQTFITVGSDAGRDVRLSGDEQVQPHHLDVQLRDGQWQVVSRSPTGDVRLDDTLLSADNPQAWAENQVLTIGGYALTLRQPPTAEALAPFEVQLLPAIQSVKPGVRHSVGIAIRNRGRRGYFKVEVQALPSPDDGQAAIGKFYDLPQDGVIIDAGEQRELPLTLSPPLDIPGDNYPYQVFVERWVDDQPPHTVSLHGTLRVQATADFSVTLEPEHSRDAGRFLLIIHNHGNQPVQYAVASQDPEAQLEFSPDAAVVAPRRQSQLNGAHGNPTWRTHELLGASRQGMRRLSLASIWQRSPIGRQTTRAQTTARRVGNIAGTMTRGNVLPGSPLPRQATAPAEPIRYRHSFEETLSQEVVVAPGHQAILRFVVRRRRRPLRWQAPRTIPFAIVVTPVDAPVAQRQPQTVHGQFEATSRLGRAGSVLLAGLLLLVCLLAALWAAFNGSQHAQQVRAAQAQAAAFALADPDGDGLNTQEEVTLWGTDPQRWDSDGDGISDGVEASLAGHGLDPRRKAATPATPDGPGARIATATPTGPAGQPFPTAELPPTPTPLPTVAPTFIPPPAATESALIPARPPADAAATFTVGDTAENEPVIRLLTFDTRLPAGAVIQSATLALVLDDATRFDDLQARLGPLYVTVGSEPLLQSIAGLQPRATAEAAVVFDSHAPMMRSAADGKVLIAVIPPPAINTQDDTTLSLYFELASNLDRVPDALGFYAESPPAGENPPTLYVTYLPAPQEESSP